MSRKMFGFKLVSDPLANEICPVELMELDGVVVWRLFVHK